VDVVSPFTQVMSGTITEAVVGYLQGEMRSSTSAERSKEKKKR
jgi:hypothetical protein